MREPNLKIFTLEEEQEVREQAVECYRQGKEKEGDALLDSLPMPAEYLQTLKKALGIDALINEGINLSNAVEKYGKAWLVS